MSAIAILVAGIILVLLGVFVVKWFLFVGIVVLILGACAYFFGGARLSNRRRV